MPLLTRLNASLLAGLGAGFGWTIYRALFGSETTNHTSFLLEFVVMGIFLASFWHPVEKRFNHFISAVLASRSAPAFQLSRAILFCLGLLLELLVHRVGETRSATDLVISVALAGSITFGWCYGYRRMTFGATLWGTSVAVAAAMLVVVAIWYARDRILFDSVSGRFVVMTFMQALLIALNNAILLWAIIGFFGGLAVDFGKGRKLTSLAVLIACVSPVMAMDYLLGLTSWRQDLAMLLGWGAMLTAERTPR